MVRGHADFQTPAGRGVGGAYINTSSFSGNINSDSSGIIDFGAIPSNTRHSLIQLDISCPDDTAIHELTLIRISDGWIFFQNKFVTSGHFPINSDDLVPTQEVRLTITNKSTSTLTFVGTLSWVVKEI